MTAVRYRGVNDDRDMAAGMPGPDGEPSPALVEADHVLDDHADLPALLGLT